MPKTVTASTVGTRTPDERRAARRAGARDYHLRLRAARVADGLPERIEDVVTLDLLARDFAAWQTTRSPGVVRAA